MRSRPLFLAPHNDDEVLFGCWTLLREAPDVVVCLEGHTQEGVTARERQKETDAALAELDLPDAVQWAFLDTSTKHEWVVDLMRVEMEILADRDYPRVYAPAIEEGGHEQHSLIGQLALDAFGAARVMPYLTYRRGHGRSTRGVEVPFEPEWIARKLRALSCYVSQMRVENCRYWFLDSGLREFYAEP